MSYQQYMNMGFGAPQNPYMMGFQSGMPRQMAATQNQYIPNHRLPAVNVGAHPMTHNWAPAAPNVASSAKRKPGNDPNRPKRPTSAYFYFVQLEREEAAKRGEKITRVAEWTKAISVKWRELTAEQKETFQKMAANDKQRYTQQMAIYTGKDANRPKRPQSAYFLWLADFRAQMKDKFVENRDILRAAGEEWRRLTTTDKVPYEQRAEEERRKYEQAMKEYNMSGGAKKRLDDIAAGSSSMPSASAYNCEPSAKLPRQQELQQQQQQLLPSQLPMSQPEIHQPQQERLPQALHEQLQQQQQTVQPQHQHPLPHPPPQHMMQPAPTTSVAVSAVAGTAAVPLLGQTGRQPSQDDSQDDDSDEKDSDASSDASDDDDGDGSE